MAGTKLRKKFDKNGFDTGASPLRFACWYFVSLFIFRSGLVPFSNVLVFILRLFGARIGKEVRIKPHIYIRYPWKLRIGDRSWLADCYIDNLDQVIIGSDVCISQHAMLITGNHNYGVPDFNLLTSPILIEDGVWICAGAIVAPGVTISSHAVLSIGSVATRNLQAYTICRGDPAVPVKKRQILSRQTH